MRERKRRIKRFIGRGGGVGQKWKYSTGKRRLHMTKLNQGRQRMTDRGVAGGNKRWNERRSSGEEETAHVKILNYSITERDRK